MRLKDIQLGCRITRQDLYKVGNGYITLYYFAEDGSETVYESTAGSLERSYDHGYVDWIYWTPPSKSLQIRDAGDDLVESIKNACWTFDGRNNLDSPTAHMKRAIKTWEDLHV